MTRLAWLRRRAAVVLWVERLVALVYVPAGLVAAYVAASLFGLGNGWLLAGLVCAAAGWLGWRGRYVRAPSAFEIDRRIEADSGWRHRPLAALADMPAAGDARLWALHQARVLAGLGSARVGGPAPVLSTLDPYGLRALLALLLITGLVMAGGDAGPRLAASFALPAWPFAGPQIEAWLTPPAYTGQPPQSLAAGAQVTALAGSTISLIENGSTDAVRFGGAKLPATRLAEASRRADVTVAVSGALTVGPWWHRLASWDVTVVPPAPPVVTLTQAGADARFVSLGWQAKDDYGLAQLAAVIMPPGYPDAAPEHAALPTGLGAATARLAVGDSPYAGLSVMLRLHAKNMAGVEADSGALPVSLPPDNWQDKTAILLSVIRQNLALMPRQAPGIAAQMRAVASTPPSAIGFAQDVQLAALAEALRISAISPAGAVARLLPLMKAIEAGPDAAERQAVAQAGLNLLNALAKGTPDAAQLNQLLQQMRQALSQLAAAAPGTPETGGQQISGSDIDQLAQKIAADEAAGRQDAARAEMRQLAQMLHDLQNAKRMTPAQAAQAKAANAAASALEALIPREAGVLDATQKGQGTPDAQAGVRQGLNAAGEKLGQGPPAALGAMGQAGQAMDTAQGALSAADGAAAAAAEQAAIAALQKAAAALRQAGGQELSVGQGGAAGPGGGDDDGGTGMAEDPGGKDLLNPAENRANEVEQEILREDARPDLPQAAHDYLKRLLTPGP